MAVIDSELAMRNVNRTAKLERFEPGATAAGGTFKSTNVQDAIDEIGAAAGSGGGAPLNSPAFTGIPTAPTAAPGTNTTQIATTQFVETAISTVGASVTISDTAPVSPSAGNLWWNSTLGQMYIYYNDGTSAQWVVITTAQAVGSGGGGGSGGAGSFTTSIIGAGTYIVPSGKTTLVGEAWGSGGGGGSSGSSSKGGGGGGGYSKFTTAVTPGNTIYYSVGTPGAGGNPGTNGGNSWVNPAANSQPATTGCVGGGGGGAGAGVGGGGSGTIGTTNFTGGNGAGSGGGGGGCAGSAGNGATATSSTGGAGGSPDGGAGGLGATGSGVNGNIGTTPGGGGGGSVFAGAGGGGNGQVRLTFS